MSHTPNISKSVDSGATVGRQPCAVTAVQFGSSPGILSQWALDGLVDGPDLQATQTFFSRMAHPRSGVPEDILEALEALIDQKDHKSLKKHAPLLKAWMTYLDLVSNPDRQRLHYFNMGSVPGINTIKGIEYYGIRGLAMPAGAKDIVVIPDGVPNWAIEKVQALRKQAGLPVGKIISQSTYEARRAETLDFQLEEFYRTNLSPDKKGYILQETFENKNIAMAYLEASGIAVPRLYYAGPVSALDLNRIPALIPVVLKAVRSAGGAGVTLCRSAVEFYEALAGFSPRDEIQIQQLIQGIDCSKQYFVTDDAPVPITNTDQIIKGGVAHAGNIIMSQVMDAADNQNADRAAWAIWATGYRGYCALDLVKPQDEGLARVIEANLRKGGVTVPTTTGNLIGADQFVAKQIIFENQSHFEDFVKTFALHKNDRSGVLVNAIMPLDNGHIKIEALCISPTGGQDVAHRTEQHVERRRKLP